jgi:hypothetical protein
MVFGGFCSRCSRLCEGVGGEGRLRDSELATISAILKESLDSTPEFSTNEKEFDEENRAQKPSLLLRPALLVWFEVRVTRVCAQKSA